MQTVPSQFHDEPIEVIFKTPPVYEKKPDCPQAFIWRGETFSITEVLEEWVDYARRGKMGRNMQPAPYASMWGQAHLASAKLKGSWGVGRFSFRVKVDTGQLFEIYYDRAPENCDNRKGNWFLKGERKIATN